MPFDRTFSTRRMLAIRGTLLRWWRSNARDFPWRHHTDPYRVLIAEVLLEEYRSRRSTFPILRRWRTQKKASVSVDLAWGYASSIPFRLNGLRKLTHYPQVAAVGSGLGGSAERLHRS